jgi:hypothetical protein
LLSWLSTNFWSSRPRLAWLVSVVAVYLITGGTLTGGTLTGGTLCASDDGLRVDFEQEIKPFLQLYCNECHSGAEPEAKFDTSLYQGTQQVTTAWDSWKMILSRVESDEMPPADAGPRPTDAERQVLRAWTDRFRQAEALRNQGDPGPVSIRRLSNAEWNYTIRDLTGIDIQPAADFPVDPANEAGFDNSAESLTMSPALVNKYLNAARKVSEHLLLTPEGIRFAPFPVVTDTDRDKYCVQRIVDFYQNQPTELVDYLLGCHEVQTTGNEALRDATITATAARLQLSEKYLTTVWQTLNDPQATFGPLRSIQQEFNRICARYPGDSSIHKNSQQNIRRELRKLAKQIGQQRERLQPQFENLPAPAGMNGGSQSLVLWKNRQMATHRRSCRILSVDDPEVANVLNPEELSEWTQATAAQREQMLSDLQRFCAAFPDAFYIQERGRAHIDAKEAEREGKGRLLSAGFHSMMGYFRDDQPLYELVLTETQQRELDQLWFELDFIAMVPFRQYSGFIWFERAESSFINEPAFHFIRAEDRAAASEVSLTRFAEVYLDKVRRTAQTDTVVEAVEFHFRETNRQLRTLEKELAEARQRQLDALIEFAGRAFRRPLVAHEIEGLTEFYREVLEQAGGDHRTAMEDSLVAILVSPNHLFRWDLQTSATVASPLNDLELASRLSYFLWSSMPDSRLLKLAESGMLRDDKTRREETTRILADPRVRGMAKEFMGNWLDFRRFESHNGVDREQFPQFSDPLRQAMADEPIEFLIDLLKRDGSLLELLDSQFVVVNGRLAEHYGLSEVPADSTNWSRVSLAGRNDRGGLIPMAVFLTQNSPGLRTSPVKRGYWVVRKLLGETIPPPPPGVPELPSSEHQLGELTLREVLAKHREHPSCASCHDRFDAFGLVLEGYDPIGRPRDTDLAGRAVMVEAEMPNGQPTTGLAGLKDYIRQHRLADLRRHFCESLLSYALGRTLILPDDLLVEEMMTTLSNHDDRVLPVFEVILNSPQFLQKRAASAGLQEVSGS